MPETVRHLSWDGCLNVRDIGGYLTAGAQSTRFGAVVRADNVRRLSDSGWNDLLAYGVQTIIDLRFDHEIHADPPGEAPVEVVRIPVFADADEAYWERLVAISDAADSTEASVEAVYVSFLEQFHRSFADALAAVAEAPEGCLVVHCMEGKDRTGLVAALLLRLAGVSVDDIATDYAISSANLAPRIGPWIEEGATEEERARRRRISSTPAQAMRGALAAVERRYGSAGGYLREGGMDEWALDAAAARLLG